MDPFSFFTASLGFMNDPFFSTSFSFDEPSRFQQSVFSEPRFLRRTNAGIRKFEQQPTRTIQNSSNNKPNRLSNCGFFNNDLPWNESKIAYENRPKGRKLRRDPEIVPIAPLGNKASYELRYARARAKMKRLNSSGDKTLEASQSNETINTSDHDLLQPSERKTTNKLQKIPTRNRNSNPSQRWTLDSDLRSLIEEDIVQSETGVSWDDIVGLEDVKQVFRETFLLPKLMPQLFKGILRPWRGILLFGPPGTGKTLLAKALASQDPSNIFLVPSTDQNLPSSGPQTLQSGPNNPAIKSTNSSSVPKQRSVQKTFTNSVHKISSGNKTSNLKHRSNTDKPFSSSKTSIASLKFPQKSSSQQLMHLTSTQQNSSVQNSTPPESNTFPQPKETPSLRPHQASPTPSTTTFFNVLPSTLTSKHYGESEKLVRTLFATAKARAPSVIFLDEIDALCSRESGHEATRRVRAEVLSHMDGLLSGPQDSGVVVLAATNHPWDLDEALKRRFEKRIYIGLPDETTRGRILDLYTNGVGRDPDLDMTTIARQLSGYSGSDIKTLCQEAILTAVREFMARMDSTKTKSNMDLGAHMGTLGPERLLLKRSHFEQAMAKCKKSVDGKIIQKYKNWNTLYGSR